MFLKKGQAFAVPTPVRVFLDVLIALVYATFIVGGVGIVFGVCSLAISLVYSILGYRTLTPPELTQIASEVTAELPIFAFIIFLLACVILITAEDRNSPTTYVKGDEQ